MPSLYQIIDGLLAFFGGSVRPVGMYFEGLGVPNGIAVMLAFHEYSRRDHSHQPGGACAGLPGGAAAPPGCRRGGGGR